MDLAMEFRRRDAAGKRAEYWSTRSKSPRQSLLQLLREVLHTNDPPNRKRRSVDALVTDVTLYLVKRMEKWNYASRKLVLDRFWLHSSMREYQPAALGCPRLDASVSAAVGDLKESLHIVKIAKLKDHLSTKQAILTALVGQSIVGKRYQSSLAKAFVVHEFAKVAVAILKGEGGTKGFAKAARHLQTTVEAVAQAVSTISSLYSRAASGSLSHQQLVDFLSIQGFGENLRQALTDSVVEHVAEIREVISVTILQLPTYQGLDWRLDLQVASRSLRNQSVPTFLLRLSKRPARLSLVKQTGEMPEQTDEVYLEARYVTLKAVCSQLDLALAEARSSAHGFRVMRLIR